MKKFYERTTAHPKLLLLLFILISVICSGISSFVNVNQDIVDYLPDATASTIALDKMDQIFGDGIPNARIMINNVSIPEALAWKEKLKETEHITEVTWLDDAIDITEPLELFEPKIIEAYYKDNNALMTVTIDENYMKETIPILQKFIGENNAMEGSAVSASVSTDNEINLISVIAVIFVLVVLLLTTSSWIEPVLILSGLGIAIVINAGTNLMFGTISFVSNSAGSILLLAVSLDYVIFLLHRFAECRTTEDNAHKAMVNALCQSTNSILSSGMTTIIGFLALCLMQFKIGPDMGFVLAKGVIISLICTFILMPSLILTTYKWIDKSSHRIFISAPAKLGNIIQKVMIPVVILFAILLIPSRLASNANEFYYGSAHFFNSDTTLGADIADIQNTFGKSDTFVLLVPSDDFYTQTMLSNELKRIPQITSVISYVDTVGAEIPTTYLDKEILSKLISDGFSRYIITASIDSEGDTAFTLVEQIRLIADSYYPDDYYLAGNTVGTYDLMKTITNDMKLVNFLAILAVFIVLLISMKSIILPILLVLSIEAAIWINLSFPYFMGDTLFYIAYLIISSIQLGATVDYAILFTDKYLDYRRYMPKKAALYQMISACTISVLTSGSVMTVVGFLLGAISSHELMAQLGIFLGRGTLCSLAIVFLVLPGLLYIFDHLIEKTTKNLTFMKG